MTIQEFLRQYYMHDSLLEEICCDVSGTTAVLKVDFCTWAQAGYTEAQPETQMMQMRFDRVHRIEGSNIYLDSNTILECRATPDNETGVELVVCRDYEGGDHSVDIVRIYAEAVTVTFGEATA
jgi:hypothetical protein